MQLTGVAVAMASIVAGPSSLRLSYFL